MDHEISPAELATSLGNVTLIDVRGAGEAAGGGLAGARLIPSGSVVESVAALGPVRPAGIVVYCTSGRRSRLAVEQLRAAGLPARSLAGGFAAWQAAGLPWERPATAGDFDAAQLERYSRHLRLAEIGLEGQRKLRRARVLCVGAGGLGSPAALYLAAAGIGELGIVDADVVELSNLQRQVLHATPRIGQPKVESAAATLVALNPDVRVRPVGVRLTPENAAGILRGYDVIVDGSDNFATRYAVNDAALVLGLPVIHAAIQGFEGQLTAFRPHGRPCYRCLFPAPPPPDAAPSCDEAGVLGVLPGILGTLQAAEALKLILGIGEPLAGRLLVLDALSLRFHELAVAADPGCSCAAAGRP